MLFIDDDLNHMDNQILINVLVLFGPQFHG